MNHNLTYCELKELLDYNPDTGVFLWKKPPRNHQRLLGREAGSLCHGYILIKIDRVNYKAHRLAWLWVNGAFPEGDIDHKDADPLNNTIRNLRLCTHLQNQANRGARKARDLPKGVRRMRSKFVARIGYQGKSLHIGVYDTPEDAAAAYYEEAKRYYGEFARMDMGVLA